MEGFAAYVHALRCTRSAATVNQALAAGRKAFLQAAERLALPAKDLVDPRCPSKSLNEKLFPFHYPFMERAQVFRDINA